MNNPTREQDTVPESNFASFLSKEPSKSMTVDMDTAKKAYPDMTVYGNPGSWQCLCKAEVKGQWMKSTKAVDLGKAGCLVQVSTEKYCGLNTAVAEAVVFVPISMEALKKSFGIATEGVIQK